MSKLEKKEGKMVKQESYALVEWIKDSIFPFSCAGPSVGGGVNFWGGESK